MATSQMLILVTQIYQLFHVPHLGDLEMIQVGPSVEVLVFMFILF